MAIDYGDAEREIQEYLGSLDGFHRLSKMELDAGENTVMLDVSFSEGSERPRISPISETVSELLDAPVEVSADYDPSGGLYRMEIRDIDGDPVPDDPQLN